MPVSRSSIVPDFSRRLLEAQRELERTDVGRGVAAALCAVCALAVLAVPAADLAMGGEAVARLARLAGEARAAAVSLARGDALAAHRGLQRAIAEAEEGIEEGSVLRRRLLPPTQWLLTRGLALGNEQAYLGLDGWLFYRSDVDHVLGRGFLEPRVLAARATGGDAWRPPPSPDPRPALERLAADLASRGARLLLLPTPVKPAILPERFSRRAAGVAAPLRNPSFGELAGWAESAGVEMVDPAPWLAAGADGEPVYLATDTHWTPAAMEGVARALADRLRPALADLPASGELVRRPVVVEGRGDIAAMLGLPEWARLYPPRPVELQVVLTAAGRPWRPEPSAALLLLGDSFTNVFSDPALGWGAGAGLGEQLAFHLQRPLDRIAVNAGGARAAREALARDAVRLRGKRLVVYQFATRELSQGDWVLLPLPDGPEVGDRR